MRIPSSRQLSMADHAVFLKFGRIINWRCLQVGAPLGNPRSATGFEIESVACNLYLVAPPSVGRPPMRTHNHFKPD